MNSKTNSRLVGGGKRLAGFTASGRGVGEWTSRWEVEVRESWWGGATC